METINNNLKNTILVFDVETTGLLPKKTQDAIRPTSIDQYPHIIQFSFVLYDLTNHKTITCYDSIINIPKNVEIPKEVETLTGIETSTCHFQGENIVNALISFESAYKQCKCLVAHNMDFDMEMILVEIERNREEIINRAPQCFTLFHSVYERINNIDRYCTMRKGTNMCNILVPSSIPGRPPRKKWPRLSELHSYLFNGETVDGLHNSLIDVMVCLKCYLKMTKGANGSF